MPGRPWHTHDEPWPLTPGEPVALDIEIWPTSMVFPKGYTLALTVMGRDFEFDGIAGRILHNAPSDRDPHILGPKTTLWCGPSHPSFLTLPVVT